MMQHFHLHRPMVHNYMEPRRCHAENNYANPCAICNVICEGVEVYRGDARQLGLPHHLITQPMGGSYGPLAGRCPLRPGSGSPEVIPCRGRGTRRPVAPPLAVRTVCSPGGGD